MGCFLGCFGSSKDRKRRKQRNQVLPRDQKHGSYNPVKATVSLGEDNSEKPPGEVPELQEKPDQERLSTSARKKVTFDSNVKTYEHISDNWIDGFSSEGAADKDGNKEKRENLSKSSHTHSSSDDGVVIPMWGTFPPDHRYYNCRDSDEEFDFEESDLEDDDNDGDEEDQYDDYDQDKPSMESRNEVSASRVTIEELRSPLPGFGSPDHELKTIGLNQNARHRSAYVHNVLNPVENLTQWRAIKAKEAPPLKLQKEGFTLDEQPRVSFSLEHTSQESSFSIKFKSDRPKCTKEEISVDASLSSWIGSSESESTPISEATLVASESEKWISNRSDSLRSLEDRPILGALTVEELRQFSASTSPRKSPSRSPDEMPIIGTVGGYWCHVETGKDSGSASSYKGIPNTTSKYREDKRVNWHSTPFETRLERALKKTANNAAAAAADA
ncbi:uncharacterized protein LOC131156373 [Malania oleifera]|uniref:uncharacterized protein LOC131156373 n=1 Tax=Malania oleifera TaxID=397392 RepID=UPI0025AEB98D|nr:uncharacterized protein LOC131156373 [Malania oleifera]